VVLISRAFATEAVRPYAATMRILQGRPDAFMPRAELLRRVATCDGLVAWGADHVDAELLDAAPRLRIVANFGVGFDSVDPDAAAERGIWVTNTPDVLTESTADVALLLVLAALRRAGEAFETVRHGRWRRIDPSALWGRDPAGLTLGLLGFGRIGQALARRVQPLGMRVRYHARRRVAPDVEEALNARRVSLDELLRSSDVLSIHVPLTEATRGMLGPERLARLPRGAVVVNTARGAVLDEQALADLLENGHIAAVGLDAFADEPHVPRRLRQHPRAFCLPHIGSATAETRLAMMRLCLDNVTDVLLRDAEPRTPVNRPRSVRTG
jgi:glyoxylate reductase